MAARIWLESQESTVTKWTGFQESRKQFSRVIICLLMAVALLGTGRLTFGQTTAGSIIGTLTDQSTAVLPDTDVTLVNVETQDKRLARTNQDGHYQFVNIPPGRYSLVVQRQGYSKLQRGPLEIQVASTVEANLVMQIGSETQTVTVTGAVPLLNVETTSLGTVIGQRQTTELPLNGRNPMNLTALVPSVVPQGGAMQNSVGLNPFAWGNYQIGGAFANQSATFLDGSPLNAEYINIMALVPPQDSIQEFKVDTNNLPAEFGRFSGGAINFTTKSGTNEIHGSAWEFIRNKVLNANTFFAKRAGLGRPAFTQNQYGGNIGGPVFIPHLYDGRNKTFFFVEYDGFSLRNQSTFVTTVPTLAERGGDLSALGVNIYDPLTTCGVAGGPACGPGQALYDRQMFPNANISQRLNPVAVAYLNRFFPLPNTAGTNGSNNWVGNSALGGDNHQIVAHIDQNVSEKQHISARYNFWAATDKPNQPFGNGICTQRCGDRFSTNDFVIADTYAFSPKTIMDVRFSYLRFDYHRFPVLSDFDLTSIGMPAALQAAIQFPGPPTMEISGFDPNGLFLSGSDAVLNNDDDNERVSGSLSKFIGNHVIKIGGEFLRGTYNFAQNNISTGGYAFTNGYSSKNPNTAVGGAGLASYLLGYPANSNGLTYPGSSLGYVVPVAAQQLYTAVYANDD